MPVSVLAVAVWPNGWHPISPEFIAPLCFLTNSGQHFDAGSQIRRWNIRKQFMPKFIRRRFDLNNDALGALTKMNRVAATIMRRASARDPTFPLQPMQQRHDSRFFHAQARRDFRLGERIWGDGQMQECAPLCLAQTHRLEPLIQLEAPGTCGPMQERANCFPIRHHGKVELVSMLTNSIVVNQTDASSSIDLKKNNRSMTIVG
jgi:hypothetical protein